ncbi:MAG: DUF4340 domain-containing protein [Spirochaetaceae bacterium]|jgi:hypothetical protein|nr:DUF4340 domain-containing protein [Spirochaetaceae bacterium]
MRYKDKLTALLLVAGVLFVIYVLTFVLSPENIARRNSQWTPLDAKSIEAAGVIELRGGAASHLEKTGGAWRVMYEGKSYPAKQSRIEDLFSALTRKADYPVRASTGEAYEKLGVDEGASDKITVKDDNKKVLVELFFGVTDATGNIYIRSAAEKEVRSGTDIFSAFISGTHKNWFDLSLFPEHDSAGFTTESVQQIIVNPPVNSGGVSYTLIRAGDGWKFQSSENAVKSSVEPAVRYILDASGEDFIPADSVLNAVFGAENGSVIVENGDGRRFTLSLGPKVDDKQTVKVSGSEYIYALSDWTFGRIWQNKDAFVEK